MDATVENAPDQVVAGWLTRFNGALRSGGAARLVELFEEDSHWRDTLALTWTLVTVSGRERIAAEIASRALERSSSAPASR
jgi:hypothetical protein